MAQRPDSAASREGPVRTCVGCRGKALAAELLHMVVEAGEVIPDPARRLSGRGAWLHPHPDCLRSAERRRAFPRAFRTQGPLDVERVRDHLERAAREHGNVGTTHVR